MEITEIKVYPKKLGSDKKLKAFVTITIDNAFVIRDIKVIEGKRGLFVAMPSAKVTTGCPKCGKKNPLRSNFCSNCAADLSTIRDQHAQAEEEEHRDVAHPINKETRRYIHDVIVKEYHTALDSTDEFGEYDGGDYDEY